MRSFAPENEPLKFNQPRPANAQVSAAASQASEADSLRELVQIVREDRADVEKTFPILPFIGVLDNEILVTVEAPFRFNSVILCVIGGAVAMTHGSVQPASYGSGNRPLADSSTPYSWLFGSNGITPGSQAGANAQPISLFTGPQEIRFKTREAGQSLTFWIHPETHLALRNAIDATYGKCTIVGAVEYLK